MTFSRSAIRRLALQQGAFGRELWRAVERQAEERQCRVYSSVLRGLDCTLERGHTGEHVTTTDGVR